MLLLVGVTENCICTCTCVVNDTYVVFLRVCLAPEIKEIYMWTRDYGLVYPIGWSSNALARDLKSVHKLLALAYVPQQSTFRFCITYMYIHIWTTCKRIRAPVKVGCVTVGFSISHTKTSMAHTKRPATQKSYRHVAVYDVQVFIYV